MKKVGIIWIVILVVLPGLVVPCLGFSSGEKCYILSRKIITVDTEPGVGDYTSIKEAVNNASAGDIIEVFSGTYYEHNIVINKDGISLIGIPHELGNGSETGKPFINGQEYYGNILALKGSNVTITGFCIKNNGGGNALVNIDTGADYCIFSDNDLSNSPACIFGCGGVHCQILNNNISNSSIRDGIMIWGDHNIISGNIISNCCFGITFWNTAETTSSSYNTITRNIISHCSNIGIQLEGATHNTFQHNTIENNPEGLLIYAGLGNIVEKNNFINNEEQAYFNQGLGFTAGNKWSQNYWGKPHLLPYLIHGIVFIFVPWIQFDWFPASEPYNISMLMD